MADYTYIDRKALAAIGLDPRSLVGIEDLQRASYEDNPAATATAQGTANTGVANAATAQTTAETGVANAAAAQSTADQGVSDAATAQAAADAAQARADAAYASAAAGVQKNVGPSFAAPSGPVSRAALSDYTAPTISNPPTQSEVQALANQMQALTRAVAAIITDLRANGALSA